MDSLNGFPERDAFAKLAGIELLEMGPGKARACMPVTRDHLNAAGTVHGGAIFTLADFVFAMASNSHGRLAVAINVSISYLKAVRQGVLTAEAEEISLNQRIGTYLIRIVDDEKDLVAMFQGTVYRKKETLEEWRQKYELQ
jgi:acyl-CoA thioesterase